MSFGHSDWQDLVRARFRSSQQVMHLRPGAAAIHLGMAEASFDGCDQAENGAQRNGRRVVMACRKADSGGLGFKT